MPRVSKHTASNRGRTYNCQTCGQPIEAGQAYYMWVRRIGPKSGYRQHVACGFPRPTQLSSRKTAAVEEAVQGFHTPESPAASLIEAIDMTQAREGSYDTLTVETGAWEDVVDEIAATADSVADEYEDGVSNMPDALQYSPTAEAMNDVAERLRQWAEELRDKASEELNVDLPEYGPDDTDENWLEAVEQAIQDAWDEHGSEIESVMGEMPEYEG